VIELDAEPVGFVGGRQRQGHWRILLVAEVEEDHVIGDLAGAEGQQVFRMEFPTNRLDCRLYLRAMGTVWHEPAAQQPTRRCHSRARSGVIEKVEFYDSITLIHRAKGRRDVLRTVYQ
jgi:hypothetical protein